jgi:hypothetical protein
MLGKMRYIDVPSIVIMMVFIGAPMVALFI